MNLAIPTDGKTVNITWVGESTIITISPAQDDPGSLPPAAQYPTGDVIKLEESNKHESGPRSVRVAARKVEQVFSSLKLTSYAAIFLCVVGGAYFWASSGKSGHPVVHRAVASAPVTLRSGQQLVQPVMPSNPASPNQAFGLD